jgi:hypothetical protein
MKNKNDRLTKMRVSSFEVSKVDGDWCEVTARWHKTSDACRGVANLFWQSWVSWHFQKDSESKLRKWLDCRESKGKRAAKKCPVHCYPAELSRCTYGEASRRFPELAKGEIVLILNRLSSGLKSRKASRGSLPGWSAILLHHESHPSFTQSYPILFDKGNTTTVFEPPAKPGENWHVSIRVSRREENGRGVTYNDRMEVWCQGRKVQSQVAILRRIASGEYSFKGSQLQYCRSKRKWFLKLCYEMPRPVVSALDPAQVATLRAHDARPWELLLPSGMRIPGGHGGYVAPVRRQLLMQRWQRRANYENAGHANKGHGRTRAGAGPQWKLQQRWKNFVKRVNSGVATEVLKACTAANCGTLVYEQPDGEFRETRFLASAGKVEGKRDATGWDWFQVRTMLEQRAPDYGVAVIVKKVEGSGDDGKPASPREDAKQGTPVSSANRTAVRKGAKRKTGGKIQNRSKTTPQTNKEH